MDAFGNLYYVFRIDTSSYRLIAPFYVVNFQANWLEKTVLKNYFFNI
jgi:hypothetical protein